MGWVGAETMVWTGIPGEDPDYCDNKDKSQTGILDVHPDPGWEHTKVRAESHGIW